MQWLPGAGFDPKVGKALAPPPAPAIATDPKVRLAPVPEPCEENPPKGPVVAPPPPNDPKGPEPDDWRGRGG